MKLYGGKNGDSADEVNDKKKTLTVKQRILIAVVLLIAATVTTVAAVAMKSVRAPELVPQGDGFDGFGQVLEQDGKIAISDAERRDGFITVLVVGTDKVSGSTDTIMLSAFDVKNKKLNIMSIPRDTIVNVKRNNKKINSIYGVSGGDMQALYDEVEAVTGIRPDRYVLVSIEGFETLIDTIGGITVDVPIDMNYEDPAQDLTIHIKKGMQTLNGYDAMGFMRYRATYVEGDIGRIKVQQTFVDATVKKMLTPATLTKLPELAKIVNENVKTDLTAGNIIWLGKELIGIDTATDIKTFLLPGYSDYYQHLSYYFPKEEDVLALVNESFNPHTTPITKLNLFKK